MKLQKEFELLESPLVEMDPLTEGFAGVLVEIHRRGDRYLLLETAPTTGNRLLRFSSKHKHLVYAALACELGDPRGECASAILSAATPSLSAAEGLELLYAA